MIPKTQVGPEESKIAFWYRGALNTRQTSMMELFCENR